MRAMAMIPTYNEAPNIEPLLREILGQGPDVGAVVVDDNSPDGTAAIVERLRKEDSRVHLILRKNERGRGTAGVAGFKYAVAQGVDYIVEMDADFSHQPAYISSFLRQMDDCDLLIASRLVKGGGSSHRGGGPVQGPPAGLPDQGSSLHPGGAKGWRVHFQPKDHAECPDDDAEDPVDVPELPSPQIISKRNLYTSVQRKLTFSKPL